MIASRSRLVMPVLAQMVRACDEVVEAVLLGGEPAGVVPLLAVLAAAADVRDHEDAALLEPQQPLGIELRHQRDRVAAVGGQQRRRGSVPRRARRGDDVEGDCGCRPSRPRTRGSPRSRTGRPDWSCPMPSAAALRRRSSPTRSRGSVKDSHDQAIRSGPSRARRAEVRRHRADRRNRRCGQWAAVEVEGAHLLRTAVHVHHPDRAAGHREVLDDHAARRHDLAASATVAPSVSGSRSTSPCGASRRDSRYSASVPSTACMQLSAMSASLPPRAVGLLAAHEDLPVTTITLLHPVHHPAAVGGRGQEVLRDPLVGEAGARSTRSVLRRSRGTTPAAGNRQGRHSGCTRTLSRRGARPSSHP